MAPKIIQVLKNFIFPRITELELITLFYLFILLIISYKDFVFNLIFRELLVDVDESYALISVLILIFSALIYSVYKLIYYAIHKHPMSFWDKKFFIGLFYAGLSFISVASVLDISLIETSGFINKLEVILICFILFRSVVMILLTFVLSRANMKDVYATQMTDEQAILIEIIIVVLLSTFLYIFLGQSHGTASAIILSYFYTTTLVMFFRKFLRGKIILR